MAYQRTNQVPGELTKKHHLLALQVWDAAAPIGRSIRHPRYVARRRADGSSFMKHALAVLAVLGALAMMAKR